MDRSPRLYLLALFCAPVLAQIPDPPAPPEPSSSSAQSESLSASSRSDTAATDPAATDSKDGPTHLAAARTGVSAGMAVQSESGVPLGFVVDVVPSEQGTQERGYVVIAGGHDGTTPVPYGAAQSMVQEGKLVIGQDRFRQAPKVQQSQLEDPAQAPAWKQKADSYWEPQRPAPSRQEPHT